MSRAVVVLAFAICIAVSAEAQRAPEGPVDCTPVSMSADYGGPLSGHGISLVSLADDHPVSDAVLDRAIGKWAGKNGCSEDQLPPLFNGAVSNTEVWTVRRGRYTDFPGVVSDVESFKKGNVCGKAPEGTSRTIYIFDEPGCKQKWRRIEILAHELGHAMRLGHTPRGSECRDRLMYPVYKLRDPTTDKRRPHADDCRALKREKEREARENEDGEDDGDDGDDGGGDGGGSGDPGGGGGNPGGGADPGGDDTDRCTEFPTAPGCPVNCELNSRHPDCLTPVVDVCEGTWKDENENGRIDPGECDEQEFSSGTPGGDEGTVTVTKTAVSGSQSYAVVLSGRSEVSLSLTGLTMDFDCRVVAGSTDTGADAPAASAASAGGEACANGGGLEDDSWSGTLDAGSHTVTVGPSSTPVSGSGDYTLTLTATHTPAPLPPPALSVPDVPDFRLPSGGPVDTVLPAATGGSPPYAYSVSGLPPGIAFAASTRRASGTLPTVTVDTSYALTYGVSDAVGGSASVTFSVTVLAPEPPASPSLTGSVSARTHSLSWTGPVGGGLTRYQLQTRPSSAHAWRFTDAGTPSPSSDMGPSVRSWRVVTPWALVRQYRVRATNAVGDGAWSNVVTLTTPRAPPPPLSLPSIPNFRLPSGGWVNTVFPAASGGTPPYAYSVSGLPPGIRFAASTRRASGTLRTVPRDTSYLVVYSATDAAGASASVTFTSTVRAPPPPPSAPQLAGSVSGRTQFLSWSAPASLSAITRYQMQTRNSSAHSWRYTTAGSPSPSSSFGAGVRSWSVTTPAGLLRHYRVRATSANGNGPWSNVVVLTSD